MGKRLVNWLTFNVLFALFPLGAVVLLHSLNSTLSVQTVADSPEILFFSLMVSATALGDLDNMTYKPIRWQFYLRILWAALLVGSVLSTLLYAFLLYDAMISPNTSVFRSNLLSVSVVFAVVYGLLSTAVEALIGRVGGER